MVVIWQLFILLYLKPDDSTCQELPELYCINAYLQSVPSHQYTISPASWAQTTYTDANIIY